MAEWEVLPKKYRRKGHLCSGIHKQIHWLCSYFLRKSALGCHVPRGYRRFIPDAEKTINQVRNGHLTKTSLQGYPPPSSNQVHHTRWKTCCQ